MVGRGRVWLALAWIGLPLVGIWWVASVVGPDPVLGYLAVVVLLPAGLTLLGPCLGRRE